MTQLIPRQSVPELRVETLENGRYQLAGQSPENFTLIAFYRGYHCPKCRAQLRDLEAHLGQFREVGIDVIAISTNTAELAQKTKVEWNIPNLPVGYGLTIEQARTWGLYISDSIKPSEPDRFSEPAIYVVRPDGALYAGITFTMPFARTQAKELLGGLKYIIENDYPARGEAVG